MKYVLIKGLAMEVGAVNVTVSCSQLQSGSSGLKPIVGTRRDREQHKLKIIQNDTCICAVNSCE